MSRTLLYSDADPAVRLLVRKVLSSAGFKVLEAENPEHGRQLAEHSRPDIVLADVDGQESGGADIVERFRQSPGLGDCVLVASTAEDRPEHIEYLMAAGFQGVLLKPLDVDTLAHQLSLYLPLAAAEAPVRTAIGELAVTGEVDDGGRFRRRSLARFTENFVRSVFAVDGLLAVVDPTDEALVVVAAFSVRPAGHSPAVGARVPLEAVEWLHPAVKAREAVMIDPQTVGTSSLIPVGSTAALAVPVATEAALFGIVVLAERRQRTFAFPPAQVDKCLAEAARLAAVLKEFDRLDHSIRQTRHELERLRIDAARALAAAGRSPHPRIQRDRESVVRLSLALAQRLKVPVRDSAMLANALEVHDIGRMWIEHAVLPIANLPAADSQILLDSHAEQTAEILNALGWPPSLLDLIRLHRTWWNGEGGPGAPSGADIPLVARIMAVTTTYQTLTSSGGPSRKGLKSRDALAELTRESGSRFDPEVIRAFTELVNENGARATGGR